MKLTSWKNPSRPIAPVTAPKILKLKDIKGKSKGAYAGEVFKMEKRGNKSGIPSFKYRREEMISVEHSELESTYFLKSEIYRNARCAFWNYFCFVWSGLEQSRSEECLVHSGSSSPRYLELCRSKKLMEVSGLMPINRNLSFNIVKIQKKTGSTVCSDSRDSYVMGCRYCDWWTNRQLSSRCFDPTHPTSKDRNMHR